MQVLQRGQEGGTTSNLPGPRSHARALHGRDVDVVAPWDSQWRAGELVGAARCLRDGRESGRLWGEQSSEEPAGLDRAGWGVQHHVLDEGSFEPTLLEAYCRMLVFSFCMNTWL